MPRSFELVPEDHERLLLQIRGFTQEPELTQGPHVEQTCPWAQLERSTLFIILVFKQPQNGDFLCLNVLSGMYRKQFSGKTALSLNSIL